MRRSYGDRCGIARALDVVGERWALLVVRELVLGPKRFSDLQRGLPGIGPDMLAQRLRDLEAADLVERATMPAPAGSKVYALTDRGRELEPVLLALGRFGSTQPITSREQTFGPDAAMVALPTLFDRGRAAGLRTTVALEVGSDRFVAVVGDGELEVSRGETVADVTITAEAGVLAAMLWHGRALREAVAAGEVTVLGPRRTAERFLRLFPLPRREQQADRGVLAQAGGRPDAPRPH